MPTIHTITPEKNNRSLTLALLDNGRGLDNASLNKEYEALSESERAELKQKAREGEMSWRLAEVATREVIIDDDARDTVKNRLVDNAGIATIALNRDAILAARSQAMALEGAGGARLYGLPHDRTFNPLKAAFANAAAVRHDDHDDCYLAAEYSHPDDNISLLINMAQHLNLSGEDLVRGIVVAYEVHVALVGTGEGTGICLHEHKVDHMTHIAAGTAAGFCSMLGLSTEQTYHAINFAVHNSVSYRQSRKGDIGSQKEFVPGICAQIVLDAVDWVQMQDLKGPNPIYEGYDSIVVRALGGENSEYKVRLPDEGEPLRNIMLTYPKEHAFEYQGQAPIDAGLEMHNDLPKRPDGTVDVDQITSIVLETSHHTHHVIGTDSGDPEKWDIHAPRGTLDHSIMFALGQSLRTGEWDNDKTYDIKALSTQEQRDLQALVNKVETVFDEEWERRYHSTEPEEQAMGGKMIITLTDGTVLEKEKARANAHVYGDTPWSRDEYVGKFDKLTAGRVSTKERTLFFETIDNLEQLRGDQLGPLMIEADLLELGSPKRQSLMHWNKDHE